MPYHLYNHHKKNFVTWGVKDMLLRGDQRHGAHAAFAFVSSIEQYFWQ